MPEQATLPIAIVATSTLWADGVRVALQARPDWQPRLQPLPPEGEPAAAYVLLPRDAASALALHAGLPAAAAAVVLGDDLREMAARAAADPRALALLPADANPAQLRAALAAVLTGLSVREAGATAGPGAGPSFARVHDADQEPLTPRELEVYELLGKGLSNREIGAVLGISAHTAKYHVGQILAKVGASTRAEAVSAGLKRGLIGL
jgi:DNA-binding NarL/FixJ family response regulator